MRKIASALSRIFTGVGLFVDVILLFVPTPMHLEMRKSFEQVNAKLDGIKDQITDLSNDIGWKLKESTFHDKYVVTIITLSEKFKDLVDYERNSSAFESKKRDIIRYCDFQFLGHEFFNFLTDINFFESYVTSSKNDRRKVLNLMKVVVYYITQASKLDITCLYLKGEAKDRIDKEDDSWRSRFSEFQQLMTKIDGQVENAWVNQSRYTDIPQYLRSNRDKSNRDFVVGLRDFLMNKYYWRDWVVISYDDDVGTFDSHAIGRDSWAWIRQQGRTLVVASVPETNLISRATSTSGWCEPNSQDHSQDRAKKLYSTIKNCASAKVVVESCSDLWYATDKVNRVFLQTGFQCHQKSFTVVLFY